MWAATMPYYSEYQSDRSRRDTNQNAQASASNDAHGYRDVSPHTRHSPIDLDEYMVPAIEGPPSPERIRQLSKQMKHASHLNRGHRAVSSGSSSFVNSERGWEQGFENMSITRHSSQRSTTSGTSSSRDRPDSVQVLGKNIFHRRAKSSKSGRSRRESSAQSSSGSSLYSTELSSETSLTTFKEAIMPTIFARRKSSRDETALQKKLQISGPFNFQHVTHTPREQVANSASRTPGQEQPQPNCYSDRVVEHEVSPRSSRASNLPRRLIKHARSQEQLRTPPRPVHPPPPLEPLPLLRGSSPYSSPQEAHRLPVARFDRPLASGKQAVTPVAEQAVLQTITILDDAASPPPAAATSEPQLPPLPDVPEEESWEDDIDYCYEHEAEPTSITSGRDREGGEHAPGVQVALLRELKTIGTVEGATGRTDRPISIVNDSHGFKESPSLLSPGRYHQLVLYHQTEMLLNETEDRVIHGEDDPSHPYVVHGIVASHTPMRMSQQRASTASHATNSSDVSDSTRKRHTATNSTWTLLTLLESAMSLNTWTKTRLTSSTSLNIKQHNPRVTDHKSHDDSDEEDTVPLPPPFPTVPVTHSPHTKKPAQESIASESIVRDDIPSNLSTFLGPRPRARTLKSQATQAPQCAICPISYTYAKGNGIVSKHKVGLCSWACQLRHGWISFVGFELRQKGILYLGLCLLQSGHFRRTFDLQKAVQVI
ncbi:hypothetical protein CEK25_009001 [Fusarium fujikuroi]|nr:hypothetical protein CEK25_009001 [Fusarium fujikuroi]